MSGITLDSFSLASEITSASLGSGIFSLASETTSG
jgi:hypothetical protein